MENAVNVSRLDRSLVTHLRPLVDAGVTLYYPFFANTFPLALHLMFAAREAKAEREAKKELPKTRLPLIVQIPWSTPIRKLVEGTQSPPVFYATQRDKNEMADQVLATEVCLYQPRSVFVEQSPLAAAVAKQHNHEFRDHDVVEQLLDGRHSIDVYTDIPTQAKAILAELGVTSDTHSLHFPHTDAEGTAAPDSDDADAHLDGPAYPDSVRLYVYGAPLTAYLRRKHIRYIEFTIPPDVVRQCAEDFRTYVCTRPDATRVRDALDLYHRELFSAQRADDFWMICTAYNRIARSQQHRSSFRSAGEYVQCLNEHSTRQVLASPRPTPPSQKDSHGKPLVLFGCGKLAIGLVLPALHKELPVLVVTVPRGGGFDWGRALTWGKVTFSNGVGPKSPAYAEEFTVRHASQVPRDGDSWRPARRTLMIADDWTQACAILRFAGIVATSLADGLGEFCKAAERLDRANGDRLPLLLFENRIDALTGSGLHEHFNVQHVMCDRICSDKVPHASERTIDVTSEAYGEIVIQRQFANLFGDSCLWAPFTGEPADLGPATAWPARQSPMYDAGAMGIALRGIDGDLQYEMYFNRKRWLMNSIQHALALLAIQSCIQRGVDFQNMPNFLADALIEKAQSLELRNSVEVLVHCQIARMMLQPAGNAPDSAPLVQQVLKAWDPLSVYENLRLFTEVTRWRVGAVTDMVRRLIGPNLTDTPKRLKKFFEHIMEPFDFFQQRGQPKLEQLRGLGVPFGFTATDISSAYDTLKEAEVNLHRDLLERAKGARS